ncbi:DUF480 domain-containing protein [Mycolicibacterium brisbanense]|uniref:Methyltransferase domain-containing protein n=1 Tax=Mycolicibacterium brisbanense TaxID=146020 RepID=A0A100VWT1_9MYCO|nr:DUF480 domain-containing protein [Mycolicibacterium brisbanense]MCV7161598.1 DUF480 domain-containing protein [Mycolicibacterium brisbanense]GAS87428.1 uncharacterized protein RMCB_1524 [Mycolicibacterium brisbanense]
MDLEPVEQRILGSLLEKQVTVPASYPLTLSALRTACNQTSSREPVMDLDERTVEQTARALKDRGLLRIVWSDTGRRTLKYHQTLSELLELGDDERAVLTVLLLRGPQAPGELRTRTERLFPFSDRGAVEACLDRMGKRDQPLVRRLDRRPGQQDYRWVHELGPVDTGELPVRPAVDREAPIADSPEARDDRVRATYGAVAPAYARELSDELDALPFERWLLERVAVAARDLPIMDAGCGPGHVTAYLAAAGADAHGLDLSPEMITQARQRHPDVGYEVGDLRRLMRPAAAAGWGAVLGWYSLIHLAASELPGAVAALARPLASGGLLVLALHAGDEVRRVTNWFDTDVPALDVVLHDATTVVAAVQAAGLTDVEWYLRGPHESRGETTQRLYVVARRP